jgi:hypothetical protein
VTRRHSLQPPRRHPQQVAFSFLETTLVKPISPVADLIERLDDNLREFYEERAGIREFDAGIPRDHAESLALLDVLHMYPGAFIGVTVLEVELDGETLSVLTTDLHRARHHLADIGAREIGAADLAGAVKQFGDVAQLTHLG